MTRDRRPRFDDTIMLASDTFTKKSSQKKNPILIFLKQRSSS